MACIYFTLFRFNVVPSLVLAGCPGFGPPSSALRDCHIIKWWSHQFRYLFSTPRLRFSINCRKSRIGLFPYSNFGSTRSG